MTVALRATHIIRNDVIHVMMKALSDKSMKVDEFLFT